MEQSQNRFGLSLSVSAPSIHETNSNRSILSAITSKGRSSNLILLATYFDIGIVRILFNPSWLTDGYLWCLEYIHQRLVDISDRVLSTALTTGILPHHFLRMKSLSMPHLNHIDEILKCQYLNEETTNEIIEQQYSVMKKDHRSSIHSRKQPKRSFTLPTKYFTRKNVHLPKTEQRYTSFYRKIR